MQYPRGSHWSAHSLTIQTGGGTGATVTPGNNAYGSVATLVTAGNNVGGSVRSVLNLNSTSRSAQNNQCLVELVYDSTGSGNWVPVVSHLQAVHLPAGNTFTPKGIDYTIPVRIPAGVAIGVRASINNATVGTLKASIALAGRSDTDERSCCFSRTFGAVTATSKGTDVTTGDNAFSTISGNNGSWVSLGTTDADIWEWDFMAGSNAVHSGADVEFYGDLAFGDAGTKTLLLENMRVVYNGSLQMFRTKTGDVRRRHVPKGATIYTRWVAPVAFATNFNVIAYGYGGSYH